ncbi:MAG: CPBP family intramembrane metalloprotease domain-containing protein [Alphaproteobacteria bacterium]|nr:MAG: CPBP family intramembrane metalloprotease domain-containing protein [Alphaproteobacteria bacterium]
MKHSRDTILTLSVFFSFVLLLYFVGYWLIFRTEQATPLMLSVGLATVLTCIVRKKKLASLGWEWGQWKYIWMGCLIPLAIIFVAHLIIWTMGFGGFYNVEFLATQKESYNLIQWTDFKILAFHIILTASVSAVVSIPSILGEELGWRGLLVPELSKLMSFPMVALVSGLIWAVWHWPLVINGLYGNSVTPLYYQLFFLTLSVVSSGIIMAYLRLKSKSLWPPVMYHMSWNIFTQKVFTPITVSNPKSPWYIDEFGAVMAIMVFCVALYFLKKGMTEFDSN